MNPHSDPLASLMVAGAGESNYTISYVWTKREFDQTYATFEVVMRVVFVVAALLLSFVGECSLVAAMSWNVLSSKKEYGMMRAMGMGQFEVRRVFVEEAFVLVMGAAVMGVVCGMAVSYMMSSEVVQLLSTGLPAFYFPYATLIALVFIAMLLGYLATAGPLSYLRHMEIADCMRSL